MIFGANAEATRADGDRDAAQMVIITRGALF